MRARGLREQVKPGRHEAGPGRMPGHAVVLAVIAGLSYSTFVLGHFLNPDLDLINAYVSELSAVNQPFRAVFNTGDLVTGVCSVLVAVTALARLARRSLARAGWTFLLLFGACAIGDAVFPLDCAPSLQTWCALREQAQQVSFSHQFHAVTSSFVIVFGVLALFTLSLAARRYGWWPTLARWGRILAVAEALCGLGTLLLMIRGSWLGLMQQVQIGILCAGLLVIARALHEDRVARPSVLAAGPARRCHEPER
ncbi:hypothetical membrane protein [Thermomonospora echinospora]|uniref:Hypothetical membrane protein n=1 Tax=Thermomonospora echinospora TaxID=1992 RepID=A0A1H6E7Q8_9ACTN|nr:DUF998 domain-containing protein [Thermomonospora echinospora]SEG93179.1 hypothetical membrane protein [Thermomonospora echinospora]